MQQSSGDFAVYASLAAAETGVVATGRLPFAVRCETAGTLVVKASAGGASVALAFKAGETQYVQIAGITAAGSSGCVPITVYR